MQRFDYHRPATLREAVDLYAGYEGDARLLAGGTDLVVALRQQAIRLRAVIDIKGLADLPPAISATKAAITISATATMTDLMRDPLIVAQFPSFAEAMGVVGSVQIRNRATVVGNACHASPAADTVPALLAHGAQLVIVGPGGQRQVRLNEFILGPRQTALGAGEIVTALILPKPTELIGTAFARMTRRRGVDLATITIYCSVDSKGVTQYAYGAVGPRAFLVADETGTLSDRSVPASERDEVLERLIRQSSPITDVRASKEYRIAMLRVLSKRALTIALKRLEEMKDRGSPR